MELENKHAHVQYYHVYLFIYFILLNIWNQIGKCKYDLKRTTKLLSEIMFTTDKNEFEIYFKLSKVRTGTSFENNEYKTKEKLILENKWVNNNSQWIKDYLRRNSNTMS